MATRRSFDDPRAASQWHLPAIGLGRPAPRPAGRGVAIAILDDGVDPTHPDLAAAYDRLRRFDLADRAYRQVVRLIGPTPEVLNNQGFSYLLRGDYRRARQTLLAAKAKSPDNPHIKSNLELLAEVQRRAKGVN
ncbi:MAG: S8 family serine peptidase [Geminicoccaceae bacterium]|nr:S8 family serine peptidase [Geminicoccaceae bacterium]